ncbi:nitrilase-related carbon-nitrogen hydrolase, partial [Sporosarcina sp. NCCP-2222]|uniref:nitrilase-related carbon-nitrogen hydrolase n=1 Tax=Sporosarcina sp. NCCP-2222 TaxID=2935073 RepID=UPI0024A76A19
MKLRVSAVQYHLHSIRAFQDFADQCEHYIRNAQEYDAEFVLFPEFFTTQLLSIGDADGKALTIEALPGFTDQYLELFKRLATQYNMHIIGGTHVIEREGRLYNVAFLFFP